MHYITEVRYESGFELCLRFEDRQWRVADLEPHLDGEVFEPLRDATRFASAHLNEDVDTVVWDNGADMSPDFLYEISVPLDDSLLMMVAEDAVPYQADSGAE